MTARSSYRVYFVTHDDGRRSGILLRQWDAFFDVAPPAAYGESESDVLSQLEIQLAEREVEGEDTKRYLFAEELTLHRATVHVHPQTVVKKRPVIGKQRIPLKLTYVTYAHPGGGYRVLLPRFGWWLLVEDLTVAAETLQNAVSAALLGEKPRWIYDFRREGDEYLVEWQPNYLARSEALLSQTGDDAPEFPTVAKIAEDLLERAAQRKLPALVGAFPQLGSLEERVRLYPPPSLLLVGAPGVGKSVWVQRLAQLFVRWKREKVLSEPPRIYRTSAERIIAGMVYLGQWQERVFALREELAHEGHYLYVDRLTGILAPQSDGAAIVDLLQEAIEAGELSLIAECSEAELERCRRARPRLLSCFEIVRIEPTPPAVMGELLQHYQARKNPQQTIHPEGLRRLVHYLDLFRPDRRFPGKGFHFIDWQAQQGSAQTPKTLYPADISEAFSRYSGLPVELIADERPLSAAAIQERLERSVRGQSEACRACADVLARFKARLDDPEKPVGSLFFVGPTGVGKTELAKQVTRLLFSDERRLIRIDMSELLGPGALERLTAVGQGANSLAERVRQQPLSVVLFDEIEKAHPQVFDVLLGILGEGRLTDELGRLVDFRMTLILMTSNLGVSETPPIGFGERRQDDFLQQVRSHFRPEFFNRLDAVLPFNALQPADIEAIVELELAKASARTGLQRRQLELRVTPAARAELARRGFHPTRGARPLKRTIESLVITPLALRLAAEPTLAGTLIPVLFGPDDPHAGAFDAAIRARAIVL